MKAEPNPNKINNKVTIGGKSSKTSLWSVLKDIKQRGSATSSTSSQYGSVDHAKIRELYSQYELGTLPVQKFRLTLSAELGIKANDKFEQILADPTRTYYKVLKTFEKAKKPTAQPEFFNSAKTHRVMSSTSLTTVGQQAWLGHRSARNIEEIKSVVRSYTAGSIDKVQFQTFLFEQNLPLTIELQRYIREHEETKSVAYHKLAKCVLAEIKPEFASERPTQNNPDLFRHSPLKPQLHTDEVSKYKSKVELVQKELDKVGTGAYLTHKRKLNPAVTDNGEIVAWPSAELEPAKHRNLVHLEHHDIFKCAKEDYDLAPVVRKRAATQRAARSSGNFLTWDGEIAN